MMGGLRSILELGFAGIALANFWSRSWELIKKIALFLFSTSKKFGSYLISHFPKHLIDKITFTTLQ
jgi:hypothetical protein